MTDKPDPMELANELEQYATSGIEKEVAHAVRDLIAENQKLKQDLRDYKLAANAEAELVDELQKENEQLAEFVIAVGGFWGNTKSKLVGEDSLAECINRGDEALLRRAADMLATMPVKHPEQIAPRDALVAAIRTRYTPTDNEGSEP